MKEIALFIEHILESIERIENYTNEKEFNDFESDIELQDAVMRRLEIIGEAVKNFNKNFSALEIIEFPIPQKISLKNSRKNIPN
jgi:uncharacterized protein with HEPN domain